MVSEEEGGKGEELMEDAKRDEAKEAVFWRAHGGQAEAGSAVQCASPYFRWHAQTNGSGHQCIRSRASCEADEERAARGAPDCAT